MMLPEVLKEGPPDKFSVGNGTHFIGLSLLILSNLRVTDQ